jgi:hypothetical protein
VRNQVSIDFKLAAFMLQMLQGSKQPIHWVVMAAAADAALVKGGGKAILVDDPARFSRVMHLSKVLALQPNSPFGNPMPIVNKRGFWCLDADPLTIALALALALKHARTRFRLLARQLDSEQVRQPTPEVIMAATNAKVLVPQIEVVAKMVDDIVTALQANGTP